MGLSVSNFDEFSPLLEKSVAKLQELDVSFDNEQKPVIQKNNEKAAMGLLNLVNAFVCLNMLRNVITKNQASEVMTEMMENFRANNSFRL